MATQGWWSLYENTKESRKWNDMKLSMAMLPVFSSMLTKQSNMLKKIIVTTTKQKKKVEAERHTWKIQGIIDPLMNEIAYPDFMKKLQNVISSFSTHQNSAYSRKIFDYIGFMRPYT